MLNYFCQNSSKITSALEELRVFKKVIDVLPQLPHVEQNLRRESLLRSSLFSARIEGNNLTLEDIRSSVITGKTKDVSKIEVANIFRGLNWVYNKAPKKIAMAVILKAHKFVLDNLSESAGHLRSEQSAIFNQAGVAIYLPPSPNEIRFLLKALIKKVNISKESGPVNAAIFHFAFEKIHPFLDGNGRVGRLLATLILRNSGFDFRALVSLEEYFEKERQAYYDLLTLSKKDVTEFVEFFLEGLKIQAEKAVEKIKQTKTEFPEDCLLPRRREILEIVRNHKMVSFDFIKRRFRKIPDSTLHYDLGKLLKSGFLKKLGTSRGVLYTSR